MREIKKKKLLFICSNMNIGGFQKSLVSTLHCMDYGKYDVDLLLLDKQGVFSDIIPKEVNVLPEILPKVYFESAKNSLILLFKKHYYKLFFIRLISAIMFLLNKGWGAVIMSKGMPALRKKYDAAIDNNGQYILYYMVDKIKADRKISYFHSDYKKWSYYKRADQKYYKKVDAIVTVSDLCVQSMKEVFPQYKDKIHCIENINSEKTVNIFPANSNNFKDDFKGTRIVTVGRACRDKGIELAVNSCVNLKERGYNIRWYWVGPCNDTEYYNNLIEKSKIKNDFVLMGGTNNPYDYMRNCDIIVHPSYFEGKAVAIEEAKILGKPIIATNFSTVYNQIEDNRTGLIVNMDSDSITKGIIKMIDDRELYNKIENNLKQFRKGNEKEIEKLYKLIEGKE